MDTLPDFAALEQARALFDQGLAAFEAERFQEAEGPFEAALALAPDRASVLLQLGATRFLLGRPEEALPLLDAALEQQRADLVAGAWRAHALVALGREAEALRELGHHAPGRADEPGATTRNVLALAWANRGTLLMAAGRHADAKRAFEQALHAGEDVEANTFFLAAMQGRNPPPTSPTAYVRKTFDAYAPIFDRHLVQRLGYRAPGVLMALLLANGPDRYRSALDLGCGTGLCGELLRPVADRLVGVDLSPGMLARAVERGLYDETREAELIAHLAETAERHDLIFSADVLIYVGDLGPVMAHAVRVLEPGGRLAFSVEAAPDTIDYVLSLTLRYAHSERHLRALAAAHGMTVLVLEREAIRRESGQPVEGLYLVLTPAAAG